MVVSRFFVNIVVQLAVTISALLQVAAAEALPDGLRDGDIVFHTSRSAQSLAIQKATHSKYSHMGLILHRDGKPYVFEAISTVQFTPFSTWIKRGEAGHFVVKRLAEHDRIMTGDAQVRLRKVAADYAGKPYDLTFEWSDTKIYCSELVWKIYRRALDTEIGRLQKLREFDLTDPAVKIKLKERYGSVIPMDEIVISPAAIFSSELLSVVAEQ